MARAGRAGQEEAELLEQTWVLLLLVPLGPAFPSTLHWLITWEVTSLRFGAWPPEFLSQKEGDFCASAQTRG